MTLSEKLKNVIENPDAELEKRIQQQGVLYRQMQALGILEPKGYTIPSNLRQIISAINR